MSVKLGKYRHFKGKEYEVIGVAKNSETLEEYVVYKALYGDYGLWIRPIEMFTEIIERDGVKQERFKYIDMDIKEILTAKDESKAYAEVKKMLAESEKSNKYYEYINDFVDLLTDKKSYVRTRAFMLCSKQARWDEEGKIKRALPLMLTLLHDEKPTVVRQCLNALKEVVAYLPDTIKIIKKELKKIDLSKYKDSMSSLIQKDIDELEKIMK